MVFTYNLLKLQVYFTIKRVRCQEKNDGNMKKISQFDKMHFLRDHQAWN